MPTNDKPLPKTQEPPIIYGPSVGTIQVGRHELLTRKPASGTWIKRISGDDPQHP